MMIKDDMNELASSNSRVRNKSLRNTYETVVSTCTEMLAAMRTNADIWPMINLDPKIAFAHNELTSEKNKKKIGGQ